MHGEAVTLLEQDAALERVATGGRWVEGPVWVPQRQSVLYSDIKANAVLEFHEPTGELSVFRAEANFTNGRTRDRQGELIECSHGARAVQRRVGDQPPVELVSHYGSARLNSPNDVVVKSDGTIWFTDPAYGIEQPGEGHRGEREYGDRWVFRFDEASGRLTPVVTDTQAPNGLAFSPDESLLYVVDSADETQTDAGHHIRVYDVIEGRLAKNGRVFAAVTPGVPDGIRVDTAGRVWSSSGDSVQVFAPDGTLVERIPVPETVSNLCFGGADGRTLYLTASSSLYRIRTTVQDAATRR